jgi:hypothetical protein
MIPTYAGMPAYVHTPTHASIVQGLLVPTPALVPPPPTVHVPAPSSTLRPDIAPMYLPQPVPGVNPHNSNTPRRSTHKRYGYATVEEHPTAGKVLRYEPVAPESRQRGNRTTEKLSEEKELFELAEWLANISCTDRERQKYFKFKAVST